MSTNEKRTEEALEKLILDIKAFVLLQGSEGALQSKVWEQLAESHDEHVRQFIEAVQAGRRRRVGQLVVVGLGELVLASILVVAGTVALVPTVVGIGTPQQLLTYFGSQVLSSLVKSPLAPYAYTLEFLLGLFLLIAAFFTLRQAALSFKGMGLSIGASEG